MRFQRLGGHVPAGHLQPVQIGQVLRQQAGLEGQRGTPLLLEQQGVVDGHGHPAGDRTEEVPVVGVVVLLFPFGQAGQGQAEHAQQLTTGDQRRGDDRAHAHLLRRFQAALTGRPGSQLAQVLDQHRIQPGHGLLAEVALRILDRVAGPGPATRRRRPATGVHLHPADQLVPLEQVNDAVIGELRYQGLRHMPQRHAQLERTRQPVPHLAEQDDPVPLAAAAAPGRLAGDDDDAVDGSRRMPQWHRLRPDEHPGAVPAGHGEHAVPAAPAEHLLGQLVRLARVTAGEAEGQDGPAHQLGGIRGETEQLDRERVGEEQVAQPVGDDHRRGDLAEDRLRGQVRVVARVGQGGHRPRSWRSRDPAGRISLPDGKN